MYSSTAVSKPPESTTVIVSEKTEGASNKDIPVSDSSSNTMNISNSTHTTTTITMTNTNTTSATDNNSIEPSPTLAELAPLTNTSMALVEFSSIFNPRENKEMIKEHIVNLLDNVDAQDVLLKVARALQTVEKSSSNDDDITQSESENVSISAETTLENNISFPSKHNSPNLSTGSSKIASPVLFPELSRRRRPNVFPEELTSELKVFREVANMTESKDEETSSKANNNNNEIIEKDLHSHSSNQTSQSEAAGNVTLIVPSLKTSATSQSNDTNNNNNNDNNDNNDVSCNTPNTKPHSERLFHRRSSSKVESYGAITATSSKNNNNNEEEKPTSGISIHEESVNMPTFTLLERLRQSLPPIRKPRRQLAHHTNTEHTHSLHRNATRLRTSISTSRTDNNTNEASQETPAPVLTSHEESISSYDKAQQKKYSVINSLMNTLDLESSNANTMGNTIATWYESTADTNASSTLYDNSYDQTQSIDQDSKSDDGHGSRLGNEENDLRDYDDHEAENKNQYRSNALKGEEHEGNDDQTLSNTLAEAAARKGGRRAAISAIPLAALGIDINNGMSNTSFGSYPNSATTLLSPAFVTNMATEAGTYTAKTANEERHLRQLMKKCHLFSDLESTELDFVVRVFNKEVHLAGSAILEQGNESTEKLYLIAEGTCEAIKNGKSLTALYPGSTFGELELMYKQAKCAATIRCVTNCTLYTLDDDSYHRIILQKTLKKREKFAALINKVPFLRGLPDYERMKVAEALSSAEYKQGEYIIHFGEKCTLMYFIMEGDVKVIGRNKGKKVDVCRLGVSDVVGELEFLFNHLAVADVVVTSRKLITACITRKHFELILGPIHERLKEFIATNEIYSNYYVAEAADEKVRNELKRVGSLRRAARRVAAAESTMETITPAASSESSSAAIVVNKETLKSDMVKLSLLEQNKEEVKMASSQSAIRVKQSTLVETQPSLATLQSIALHNKWIGSTGIDKNGELVLVAPAAIVAPTSSSSSTNNTNNNNENNSVNAFADSSIAALEKMKNGDSNLPVTVCHFPLRAIDRAEFIVVGLREDGLIFAWNETMAKLTNYSAEQAIGQNIYTYLLGEKEQKIMYDAITEARKYAGNVEEFFKLDTKEDGNEKAELWDNMNDKAKGNNNNTDTQSPQLPFHNGTFDNILPNDLKAKLQKLRKRQHTYTLARQDGLTKATASLTAIPSLTSFGEDAPEVVLLVGEEVKQGPQKIMDSTQLLASQIQAIVMDSSQEYKERLHCIAEAIANFDATYRVLTVSTERLRVVEIRQLIGQIVMDFGSECVTKGISVCQRYEGIREERAFLDVELLPECLKRIMRLCVDHAHDCHLTIIATVTEKDNLEFLIINFNISAAELPYDVSEVLKRVNVNDEDSDANDDSETNSSSSSTTITTKNSYLSDSESSSNEDDKYNDDNDKEDDDDDESNAQFLLVHVSSSISSDNHKHGKQRRSKKTKGNKNEKKKQEKTGKANTNKLKSNEEQKLDVLSEEHSSTSNSHSQVYLTHTERHQLRMVRDAVEQQGGTLIIQQNKEDANIVFLIPYMPADDNERENASLEESLAESERSPGNAGSANHYRGTCKSSLGAQPTHNKQRSMKSSPRTGYDEPLNAFGMDDDHNDNNFEEEEVGIGKTAPSGGNDPYLNENATNKKDTLRPMYNFTTLVAEDVPAHRNMLCTFLWERKHAVLPAYTFADIERLTGVADILFIDPFQSIMHNMTEEDPILLLREKTHQMAVVITSREFNEHTIKDYHTAGFITLKKPCTPVQAMQAIRKAEDKIAAFKQEAERIAMTRETLARNSRGAWRRGALLGKGTFGEVYEAVDVLTGGKMAVKEMRLNKKNVKLEQFVSEISTMCNLQHPNIIHYFYCEQSKEQNVIRVFMEYAAGGTLQTLLKKNGKLPFAEIQRLLRDVTEGLAYIHSQQYVHGDIKTANVLLSSDNKGKIGDFGTARTVQPGELIYDMQGSPLYMSPECMSAGDVDEDGQVIGYSFPSDIWSLGCVAMEMITNKPPFSHISNIKGPAGLTNYITSLIDIPDLSPLFGCRPCLIEFVSACLNPDANRRATAKDLLHFSVFSEEIDEVTNSALQALKRAQLLHILNKFVAFQEPTEEDIKYSQCVDRILNSRPAEHKNNNDNIKNNKEYDSEDNDHLITHEMSDISRVFNKRLEQKCKENEELESEEMLKCKTKNKKNSKNRNSDESSLREGLQQSSSFFESSSDNDSSKSSSSSSSSALEQSKTKDAERKTKAVVCDDASNKTEITSILEKNKKNDNEETEKEWEGEEGVISSKERRERTPNPSRPSDNMSTLSSPTPVKRSKTLARNSGHNRSSNYSPSDSSEEEFFHSSSSSSSSSSSDGKEEMEVDQKDASTKNADLSTVTKTDLTRTAQNDNVEKITQIPPVQTHEQNVEMNVEGNKTTSEKHVPDAFQQVQQETRETRMTVQEKEKETIPSKAQVCAKETSFSSAVSHDSGKSEKTNSSKLSAFAPSPAVGTSAEFQLPRPPPLPTRQQLKGTLQEINSFIASYSNEQQQKQIQHKHPSEESQSHQSGFTSSSSFANNATMGLNNVSFYGLTKNMNVSSSQMNEVLVSAASDFLKHLSAPAIQYMQNKRKTCRFPWQAKLATPSASATFHCPPAPIMAHATKPFTVNDTQNNTIPEINTDNSDLSLVSTSSNSDDVINTEALKHSAFTLAVEVSDKAVSAENISKEEVKKEKTEVIGEGNNKNNNHEDIEERGEEEVEETTVPLVFRGDHNASQVFLPRVRPFIPNRTFFMVQERRHLPAFLQPNKMTSFSFASRTNKQLSDQSITSSNQLYKQPSTITDIHHNNKNKENVLIENINAETETSNVNVCQNDKYSPFHTDKDNTTKNDCINCEGKNVIDTEKDHNDNVAVQNNKQQVLSPNVHLIETLVTEHAEEGVPNDNNVTVWLESVTSECKLNDENAIEASPRLLNKPLLPCASYGEMTPANTDINTHSSNIHDVNDETSDNANSVDNKNEKYNERVDVKNDVKEDSEPVSNVCVDANSHTTNKNNISANINHSPAMNEALLEVFLELRELKKLLNTSATSSSPTTTAKVKTNALDMLSTHIHQLTPHQTEEEVEKEKNQQFSRSAPCERLRASLESDDRLRTMSAQELGLKHNADNKSDMKPSKSETNDNVNVEQINNTINTNDNNTVCSIADKLSHLTGMCHSRRHSTNQPRVMERRILNAFSGKVESKTKSLTAAVMATSAHGQTETNQLVTNDLHNNSDVEQEQKIDKSIEREYDNDENELHNITNEVQNTLSHNTTTFTTDVERKQTDTENMNNNNNDHSNSVESNTVDANDINVINRNEDDSKENSNHNVNENAVKLIDSVLMRVNSLILRASRDTNYTSIK